MAEIYRRKVADLAAALNAQETRAEAAEILRGLIERIELRPAAERLRDPAARRSRRAS